MSDKNTKKEDRIILHERKKCIPIVQTERSTKPLHQAMNCSISQDTQQYVMSTSEHTMSTSEHTMSTSEHTMSTSEHTMSTSEHTMSTSEHTMSSLRVSTL